MKLAPRMIASMNVLQASVPELDRMIKEKISAQKVIEHLGWSGPLGAPELGVSCDENGNWQVFYRKGHPPRLLATRLSASETNAENGFALLPTNEDGEWFVESIDQRYRTVLVVAQAIMTREPEFLANGPAHIRGQALAVIANDCGIHETTVERAAAQKTIETPWGVFDLVSFLVPTAPQS
ncbi:MAG: hypothetical protein EXR98_24195 [Gemmataceae bacterium]|nr:hypothetical protein [Gemmataceae bacterium]